MGRSTIPIKSKLSELRKILMVIRSINRSILLLIHLFLAAPKSFEFFSEKYKVLEIVRFSEEKMKHKWLKKFVWAFGLLKRVVSSYTIQQRVQIIEITLKMLLLKLQPSMVIDTA